MIVRGYAPDEELEVGEPVSSPAIDAVHVDRLSRPERPPDLAGSSGKIIAGKIDLRTATEDDLRRLPGIGAITAKKILAHREGSPFRSIEDLRRVDGIGTKKMDALRPFVTVTRGRAE